MYQQNFGSWELIGWVEKTEIRWPAEGKLWADHCLQEWTRAPLNSQGGAWGWKWKPGFIRSSSARLAASDPSQSSLFLRRCSSEVEIPSRIRWGSLCSKGKGLQASHLGPSALWPGCCFGGRRLLSRKSSQSCRSPTDVDPGILHKCGLRSHFRTSSYKDFYLVTHSNWQKSC